jgi:hypothetical protein
MQIGHRLCSNSVASDISVCKIEFKKSFEVDCLFRYKLAISIGMKRKLSSPSRMKYVRALKNNAGNNRHTPTMPKYPILTTHDPCISAAMNRAQIFGISSSVNNSAIRIISFLLNIVIS